MAFEVQQIDPLDLQPNIGIGVGLPFTNGAVFNTTYTSKEALKVNLINYFLTDENERVLNPQIGAGIRRLLFQQSTSDMQDAIEATVRRGVDMWFPRVEVLKLTTQVSQDTNVLTLYMQYKVKMTNIEDELLINFEQ